MSLPESPNSNVEQYLSKISGQTSAVPEAPNSRVEQYLEYIAKNGTVSKEEIAEQVSEWLEENIHEDPTVVIDASLSVSGAAADAKATGDEIADLKADLSESVSVLKSALKQINKLDDGFKNIDGTFVRGAFDTSTWGVSTNVKYRVISSDIIHNIDAFNIIVADGFRIFVCYYNSDGTPTTQSQWKTGTYKINSDRYFRIQIGRVPENTSEIASVSEFTNAVSQKSAIQNNFDSVANDIRILHNESDKLGNGYLFINAKYANGGINYQTDDYDPSLWYRVATVDILTTAEAIELYIADGFKAYACYYDDSGTATTRSGWKTGKITIAANSRYRLQIARGTEDTTEVANISEFVNATGYISNISKRIDDTNTRYNILKNSIAYGEDGLLNANAEFVNGSFDISTWQVNESVKHRVIGKQIFYSDNEITITVLPGFKFYLCYYNDAAGTSFVTNSGWKTNPYRIQYGKYFRIQIARVTENTAEVADVLEFVRQIKITAKTIVDLNRDVEVPVIQAKKTRAATFNDTHSALTFVHFSDVHASEYAWRRVVDYVNYYQQYLDFAIHTGDYVQTNQTTVVDLYALKKPASLPILNVVGNHDILNSDGTTASQSDTRAICFNDTAGWDVTFGSFTNAMYYYRDFSDANIRLIVIDMYYWDQTEATWFETVLNEAKTSGLSVITAAHEVTNNVTEKISTFNTLDDWADTSWAGRTPHDRPFMSYIKTFINGGGKFIIHLAGHWHFNLFGFDSNGILNSVVPVAKADELWSDSARVQGTKSFDCFNVVSVNVDTGMIKIVRIGNNVDNHMQNQNVVCYDYVNKRLISNW